MTILVAVPCAAEGQSVESGFLDRSVWVSGDTLPYQVYVPADYSDADRWPVILFLHGAGERGTDGLRQTVAGLAPAIRNDPERFPAIVVFPQAPPDSTWSGVPARAAMAALDSVMARYSIDPDRVYLTGLSMGGNGAWRLGYRHPERFAAIAPICGWVTDHPGFPTSDPVTDPAHGDSFEALADRLRAMPIWIFHGEVDQAVPVSESRQAAAALEAAGSTARYTEIPGTGHNAWDPAYASHEFTDWLFAQRRR
jgi:predicted peptidase